MTKPKIFKLSPTKSAHYTRLITSFYHVCNVSDEAPEPRILSEKEEDELYSQIYEGEVTPDRLPVNLYAGSGEYLSDGIEQGLNEADKLGLGIPPSQRIFDELRDNAFAFSGARTFQQVLQMSSELVDPKTGKIRTFSEFKGKAEGIFDQYNKNWLKTEYNQATNGAQMSSQWEEIVRNADDFPYLKYLDRGDLRVRDDHAALDGIILPVSDKFWLNYYPPNGWNCRCGVQKLSDMYEDDVTDLSKVKVPPNKPEFDFNVGVSRTLYPENHPFFVVPKEYQDQAKKNFGLPEPEKRKLKGAKPTPKKKPKKVEEAPKLTEKSTNKEIKAHLTKVFDENSKFQVDKITISTKADKGRLIKQVNQVESLLKEYKAPDFLSYDKGTNIRFASTGKSHGVVTTMYNYFTGVFYRKTINFGHTTDRLESYQRKAPFRGKSKVDEKNVDVATTVHEFFHVLSNSEEGSKAGSFWKELREVRSEYSSELMALSKRKATENEIDKVHLGRYASTNIDEFGAEAFKEYKLSKNPSKYAKKVGKIIDKHFKK